MQWVRRHRHRVILVFSLGAIAAMTYGFLKRIGIDPLAAEPSEGQTQALPAECEAEPFDGLCELENVTPVQLGGERALRLRYHLVGKSRTFFVERTVRLGDRDADEETQAFEAAPPVACRGDWMTGPCPPAPFAFDDGR